MSAWESRVFYLARPEGVIISPTLPCPLGKSNNDVQMHRGHFEKWKSSLKFPHWLYLPSEFIRILKKTFFYDCSSLSVLLVLSILARATKKIPERTIRCPVALWTSPVLTWCSVGFSAAHRHRAFMIRHHNPGKSNTFSLCGVVWCGGSVGGAFTDTKKHFLFPWCQKHWPTSVLRAEDPL